MPRRTLLIGLACAFALTVRGVADVSTTHTYLGNNPDEGNPGWHVEVQGLAHDSDYWYITQNPSVPMPGFPLLSVKDPAIWRVPVTHDLGAAVQCGQASVSCGDLLHTPLFALGYNHYGDPDVYEVGGRRYLLVPIEGGDDGAGVAVFRADATLAFLAYAAFPERNPSHSSWVTVDPDGLLVSSEYDDVPQFNRFTVDWAAFQASGEEDLTLMPTTPILLQDEAGAPLELHGAQGGEYADDGQLLYFVNGGYGDAQSTPGVHVFSTHVGSGIECAAVGGDCVIARRVERSHNGPGGFAYEFNDSSAVEEEPEGVTFWDLDADGRAPGLRGQLHVVLLDNDFFGDDAYVKHYRRSIEPDTLAPVITCPTDTVAQCSVHSGVPASDAALASFFASVSAIDACDPSPTIGHDAPSFFNLGATDVTFTARDRSSNVASCTARVTVIDTLPPSPVCPAPAVVECTSAQGIASTDPQLSTFFSAANATDRCDAAPAVSNDATLNLPLGTSPIVFTARDASGNARSCESAVRVTDSVAPTISVALSATTLWPPNHELVPITATVGVADRCDPVAVLQLVSVTSNEPDNGTGDGDTRGDIEGASPGTADTTFALRAERSGSGNGRVYTVVYRVTDASGNAATATAYVRVPRNQ